MRPTFRRYVVVQGGRYEKSLGKGLQIAAPACASPEDAADWLVHAKKATASRPDAGFCSDCTANYQAKMIGEGRCENPGVDFVKTRKGVVGVIRG